MANTPIIPNSKTLSDPLPNRTEETTLSSTSWTLKNAVVSKVIAKGKKIAAHMLEAAEAEIVFSDGVFAVSGTNRSKTFGEIAFSAYVPHNYPLATLEPGLEETAFYDPANFTYPAGTYLCEVEVDADTGKVLWSFQTPSGILAQPVTWEKNGKQYVTVMSGIGGVYALRAGDPNLTNVPAGVTMWTFGLFDK